MKDLVFYIPDFVSGFILSFLVPVSQFSQCQIYIIKVLFITFMIFRKAFHIFPKVTKLEFEFSQFFGCLVAFKYVLSYFYESPHDVYINLYGYGGTKDA